ncbi:MAG: IS630 family transposase [Nanoarchaeota archaeon]|mgnify:CR=1 FL=1
MKKDGRSISRETLENYRFQALKLRKKGWRVNKIAEAFGLNKESVSHWFTKVARQGEKSLKSTKAKGNPPKLSTNEVLQMIEWLKEDARTFGFPTPLWNCKQVQILVKKKFDRYISIPSIWELLKKLNLSPQKPRKVALEKDERLANKWLKEEWPRIKAIARRQQAMLYFQDEAGVSLIPFMRTTWAPKGKTPVIKVTGKKGGICVSSAISPAGRMVFRIEKGKMTAQTYIDFLSKIILQHPRRKIVVIADNAPIHKAKLVKEFVISNTKRISLFNIPTYSPELNPDEHVWAYLKAYELVAHQAQNKEELKTVVYQKMKKIAGKDQIIKSFFMQNNMMLSS